MIPAVKGKDAAKRRVEESVVGRHYVARHVLTIEIKSGKDLGPDPKSEANLNCLSEVFVCLVTSRDGSTMTFCTGKFSSLSTLKLSHR